MDEAHVKMTMKKEGGFRQHKEKELIEQSCPKKKTEWKYKYIFFSEVIIFLSYIPNI